MYCPNGLLCWKRVCLCVARYMCNSSIPIWYLLNIFIVARNIVCYSIRWQCHGDLQSQVDKKLYCKQFSFSVSGTIVIWTKTSLLWSWNICTIPMFSSIIGGWSNRKRSGPAMIRLCRLRSSMPWLCLGPVCMMFGKMPTTLCPELCRSIRNTARFEPGMMKWKVPMRRIS